MVLLEDTRQQGNKHDLKHKYFAENGILVNRTALPCGDYQIAGDGKIAVDSKKDIAELVGDIQVKQLAKSKIKYSLEAYNLTESDKETLFHLICDDDYERFPESEIERFCAMNHISDEVKKWCNDLYVKRHGFFHRGLVRAKNYKVKLYILVENKDGISDIKDLFRWVNPRSKIMVKSNMQIGYWRNGNPRFQMVQKYPNCMKGSQLAKACCTMEARYGCKFVFCHPEESGERIITILKGGGDGTLI